MDIHMIANILLLGYIPTIIYIAHLKTKLNNSKLNKELNTYLKKDLNVSLILVMVIVMVIKNHQLGKITKLTKNIINLHKKI